jgi:hypothetical protein
MARAARGNLDTFFSGRDLSSLNFSCIQSLLTISTQTELWPIFCACLAGEKWRGILLVPTTIGVNNRNESAAWLRSGSRKTSQNLDRDYAFEPRVARAVDFAHPACAQRP